jgi:hypothetical protein
MWVLCRSYSSKKGTQTVISREKLIRRAVSAAVTIQTRIEESVVCYYAVQNTVWSNDSDGNPWEVYVLVDDDVPVHTSGHGTCCPKPVAGADLVSLDPPIASSASTTAEHACR